MQPFSPSTLNTLESALVTLPLMTLERGALRQAEALMRTLNLTRLLLVCDKNTWEAAGRALASPRTTLRMLEGAPKPTDTLAQALATEAAEYDALLAVGSGTINDLCKYASYLAGKPYVCIPTAPSMNGYTSASASLIINDARTSRPARLPVAILADMDVLASAPLRLRRAGFGDSMARSTAQADWLLSHLLLDTAYDARPFELVAPYEKRLFADISGVHALMQVLLLSGFGMTMAGGSYPASQGEHMIAHVMEMMHPSDALHGEEIAVTTLTMAKRQERLLSHSPLLIPPACGGDVRGGMDYFGPALAAELLPLYEAKRARMGDPESLQQRINSHWPDIMAQIAPICIPSVQLENWLTAMGAPTQPQDVGWNPADYAAAVAHARFSRGRFTFLDLD